MFHFSLELSWKKWPLLDKSFDQFLTNENPSTQALWKVMLYTYFYNACTGQICFSNAERFKKTSKDSKSDVNASEL